MPTSGSKGTSIGSSGMKEPGRGREDELDEFVPIWSSTPELHEGGAPKLKRLLAWLSSAIWALGNCLRISRSDNFPFMRTGVEQLHFSNVAV